ncbi:glycosyltransferase [Microbulbifer aggregans]|uniref:glycosyltransferase n=1 Tax=Microbulbifer aggregans TaxID=1769779 RepID=UPI001CFE6BB6|nr:glycosyltransferase [Microbulbifer aggregans]
MSEAVTGSTARDKTTYRGQAARPLRVCHLFSSQEVGGLEKHVREQCIWQRHNTGAEVYVIAHPRYRDMFPEGIHFLGVDTDRSRRNPLLSLQLLRLMRRYQFDLIHAHAGKPTHLMRWLQRWIHSQVIITRHNIPHPRDSLAKHFSYRIAVSHRAVSDSALEWRVIPNGTTLPEPGQSYREHLDTGRAAVITVARLVPAKGLDILLRAWAKAEVGDAVLYLLGDGPLRAELQQLADKLDLGDRVRFTGYQPQVADWYTAADLMVIASRYEGGPYTVAEALLAGCPVVSTNVGYVAENIPAQYLTEVEDEQGLAVLLTAAVGDREALRDSYSPYFARARARLTLDAMASETWQVYLAALQREPDINAGG